MKPYVKTGEIIESDPNTSRKRTTTESSGIHSDDDVRQQEKVRRIMNKESFPDNRFGAPCSLLDPACDPENPVVVTGERILDATHRIKTGIVHTPCTLSKMSKRLEMDLYLKKDYLQVTGSFKVSFYQFVKERNFDLGTRSPVLNYQIDSRRKEKGRYHNLSW